MFTLTEQSLALRKAITTLLVEACGSLPLLIAVSLRCSHASSDAFHKYFSLIFKFSLDKMQTNTTIGAQVGESGGSGRKCNGSGKRRKRVIPRANTPGKVLRNAAGQLSGDGRREGPGENPGRLPGRVAQGRATKFYVTSDNGDHARVYPMKVWEEIEKKARKTFLAQPRQAKISGAHQLLRSSRRGGWAGAHFNSTRSAGIGADEGRSGRAGHLTYLEVWNHARFLEQ